MCHEARVQMNLLHESEDGPVFGELTVRCEMRGRGEREYVFAGLRVGERRYDRVVSKRFSQWAYLALPEAAFAKALEGSQWKGLGFVRRSRIMEEGDGRLRWMVVVNEPVTVANGYGLRICRREYELEFFSEGEAGWAQKGRRGGARKDGPRKKQSTG